MLSDVFIPMLDDFNGTNDPIEDYLVGLRLLEDVADDVDVVIPGHGSVGGADQVRARIELDRAYVHALRDAAPDDPRIGPSAKPGWEWVSDIHAGQAQGVAEAGSTTPRPARDPLARLQDRQVAHREPVVLALLLHDHREALGDRPLLLRGSRVRGSACTAVRARSR